MTERRAACMPLGYGWAGDPTRITYDGATYDCVPFRIDIAGTRVTPWPTAPGEGEAMGHSVVQYAGLGQVMIRRDSDLGASLREALSPARAKEVLSILESPDGRVSLDQSSGNWVMHEAARVCTSPDPAPLARLVRAVASSNRFLAFAERRTVGSFAVLLLAELADSLSIPRPALHARLSDASPSFWPDVVL